MYIPKHFDEPSVDGMHALMRARPLATLVTLSSRGLDANHIPLLLAPTPSPPKWPRSWRGPRPRAGAEFAGFAKGAVLGCILQRMAIRLQQACQRCGIQTMARFVRA